MPGTALPIRAITIDFDGTICPQDVSEEILQAFAPPRWWEIDQAFQRGEIGSRECLIRQARLLRGRREDMLAFALESYALDPSFEPFVRWAHDAGLRVVVASDGLGFYVEAMLRAGGISGVPVRTNEVRFNGEGPLFAFPHGHPSCVGCGTCKMRVVAEERARFGPVGFVGEGHTDRYGALYADLVFASKWLRLFCQEEGIPFLPWETFDDVRAGLDGLAEVPGPVDPELCPGWTEPRGFQPERR